MDVATLDMLRSSIARVLTEPGDRVLSDRLDELGWDDALADDAPAALRVLFEEKGSTLSSADALGPLLARTIANALDEPGLASAPVILPASLHPHGRAASADADGIVVDGVMLAVPRSGTEMVVPVGRAGERLQLAVVPADGCSFNPIEGTDSSFGLVSVTGTLDPANLRWLSGDTVAAWDAVTAVARWTISCELVGIGLHVVARAVDYTCDRTQYGRPIGTFQALQHRLAGAHVSVVGASHVAAEAACDGTPWTASVAKALAGRAAEFACTQAQQSYGAIGFTWEHEFHRYLRRTYVLDWLFGDWRTLEREIGEHLLETGVVPRIGAL
jgi:hypothetical protein